MGSRVWLSNKKLKLMNLSQSLKREPENQDSRAMAKKEDHAMEM